jgi:molecular chaperone DnaJ
MNPYEVLGLKRNASAEDIKKAYKSLAKIHHPDMHKQGSDEQKEATEKFKEVNAAYEILDDAQKKAEYDRFGAVRGGGGRRRQAGGFRDFSFGGDDFNSVFNQFFGGRGRGRQQASGEHIQVVVEVTLNEILKGVVKDVVYQKRSKCNGCGGMGAKKFKTCVACNGQGGSVQQQGPMMVQTSCGVCGGTGQEIEEKCEDCKGRGLTERKEKTTSLKIPAGVVSGMQLFFQGEGDPAKGGGIDGNLYILVKVEDHEFFDRGQNGDLLCKIPVSYTQLVLGCKVAIPTLEDVGEFSIPPGTQTGTKFKLKGKGVPRPGEEYRESSLGSIVATVEIEVPTDLTDDYMEIIDKLVKLEEEYTTPRRKKYNE